MRTAIVHDWLTGMRGGEKCLEVFCELFPGATVFTLLHEAGSVSPAIENMDIRTSFLQGIPGITRHYRQFLPLFPAAIESFDLAGYDLVLSSSHCAAKGVRAPEGALHICYCYTPMRYAWKFFDEYFAKEAPLKRWMIAGVMAYLRKWDLASNKSIDYFIAISHNVKNRIREFYGRDADVIYPPVRCDAGEPLAGDDGYYLIVSALVPYKRVDLAVKAFSETGKRLVVIGEGTDLASLKNASGNNNNIEFLGWVDDQRLAHYYDRCRALIFPGEEDFGIVPVEAQAHGKPVIAYGAGGALETVVPVNNREGGGSGPTGVFFYEQTPSALNRAVDMFEAGSGVFRADRIRENAARFGRERFKREIADYVGLRLQKHEDKK